VVNHRVDWLDPVFVWLSRIGTSGAVWLVIGLVLAALWRRPWFFVRVGAADAIAQLSALGLKHATAVDRPPIRYPEPEPLARVPQDPSFPSGHASSSFACALVLAWAAPRLTAMLLVLAAGIAFSRVYVGVHWPLDIAAGALLGVAVAITLRLLEANPPRLRRAPPAG
jgi:undecaprenyl-diphosphatase